MKIKLVEIYQSGGWKDLHLIIDGDCLSDECLEDLVEACGLHIRTITPVEEVCDSLHTILKVIRKYRETL